mmetsp:Transcript_55890/g.161882  ORF Transcript_55890/g.161882 Transcript_55890/m.161882 type:complete len:402 (+) Transcript_55890:87-1292(+)
MVWRTVRLRRPSCLHQGHSCEILLGVVRRAEVPDLPQSPGPRIKHGDGARALPCDDVPIAIGKVGAGGFPRQRGDLLHLERHLHHDPKKSSSASHEHDLGAVVALPRGRRLRHGQDTTAADEDAHIRAVQRRRSLPLDDAQASAGGTCEEHHTVISNPARQQCLHGTRQGLRHHATRPVRLPDRHAAEVVSRGDFAILGHAHGRHGRGVAEVHGASPLAPLVARVLADEAVVLVQANRSIDTTCSTPVAALRVTCDGEGVALQPEQWPGIVKDDELRVHRAGNRPRLARLRALHKAQHLAHDDSRCIPRPSADIGGGSAASPGARGNVGGACDATRCRAVCRRRAHRGVADDGGADEVAAGHRHGPDRGEADLAGLVVEEAPNQRAEVLQLRGPVERCRQR